jgi:hypothetical protein
MLRLLSILPLGGDTLSIDCLIYQTMCCVIFTGQFYRTLKLLPVAILFL